jgi:hypothetical protein
MKGRKIKNKYVNGGRKAENKIWDNYRFILPARVTHFRYVSKTVSIPEDLGCQCDWRTCHSSCGIIDAPCGFRWEIFSCTGLLVGCLGISRTDSTQRSSSRFWSRSLEHSKDGLHALLNGALRWIPITLTWKCCNDLLNLCLQHLIEAQLILRSHCKVVHLGTYVFQELVSGMNLLDKFIIYSQLISDDIPELRLISVEILPITTLLAAIERKTGLVPLRVEAHCWSDQQS